MQQFALDSKLESELKSLHPRFEKKLQRWITDVKSLGLLQARLRWKDHQIIAKFRGEDRTGLWRIALNHRYRVLYKVSDALIEFVRLEKHNKEFY